MNSILTITQLTWMEARRRRIAMAMVICGAAFIAVFALAMHFMSGGALRSGDMPLLQRQAVLQMMTLVGLYVANFLSVAMAVLLSLDTLSGEMASGVMQTLASKPIRRTDIVLGKWLAYWLMSCVYLILMVAGVVLSVYFITGFMQQRLLQALPLLILEVTVLLTLSIAGGTRFTTITNGIVAFAFYGVAFIGGWVEQIGTMVGNSAARYIGTAISLLSPIDIYWRYAAYRLQPPFMRAAQLTPFSSISAPSPVMVVWGVGFVALLLLLATRNFKRREL
ncbi:MAG: ABC transporter permease [Steroidobacteraceae bacterium]